MAALRAGYSAKTANEQAAQNLAKLSIQRAVTAAIAERSERTHVAQDRVLTELASMAFVTVRSLFTDDWQLVGLKRLEGPDSAAITGIWVKRTTTTKDRGDVVVHSVDVKLEKLGALTLLARHLGIDKLTLHDERLDLTKLSSTTIATMMEELGLEHR